MTEPGVSKFASLAASAQMREVLRQIDEGVVRIRFSEGLRRSWESARAEAGVQLAHYEAALVGARTDLAQVRLATMGREQLDDPAMLAALDIWKAHRLAQQDWPPLNSRHPVKNVGRPLPQVLAATHKALTARLSSAGVIDEADVAIPKDPRALAAVRAVLEAKLPAPMRAGLLIWLFANRPLFATHSEQLGRVLARHHLVVSGFEPSGTLLISRQLVGDAQASLALKNGDPQPWLYIFCEAMAGAVDPTLDMIRGVQAGRLSQ